MTLTREPNVLQWALPETLEVPPDELKCRLDFYQDAVILYRVYDKTIVTKMVSARDIALAFLAEVPMNSGILPEEAIWWGQGKGGVEVALWRPPRVWAVALETQAFEPPRRFRLPMPGLIFLCAPGKQPKIYAAKRRPKAVDDVIFHAPVFNVFTGGSTCPGTHKYPEQINEIPESFFASYFTKTANYQGRSKKYPENLLGLWEELDGKPRYPLKDLVPIGRVKDIMP